MIRFVAALCVIASGLAASAALAQPDLPPPETTEVWTPVPAHVTPGARAGDAPSDATILFDGRDLSHWVKASGGDAGWRIEGEDLVVAPGAGDIVTREAFGDVQLHLEWSTPVLPASNTGQNRGNSGVYLQSRYEVQVLDTLENLTYVNGQAGAIYKQYPPLVNPARPEGQWQSYDIIFTAPRFNDDGSVRSPARVTVLFNGVLVQNDVSLRGPTTYQGYPAYQAHGDAPLLLQDHGHAVRYRNIWVRRL